MIWWINRLERCQSEAEYECVCAWFDAYLRNAIEEIRKAILS